MAGRLVSGVKRIDLIAKRHYCATFVYEKHRPDRWHRKPQSRPLPFSSTSSDKTSLFRLNLEIPTPQDMEEVGAILSMGTVGGDVILLGGDLGAGKTCLSRGFVRARTGLLDMRVTSPTYLLSNTYQADGDQDNVTIHHMDLYRLSGENDLAPLNMEHVFANCISLIEWPSRLGGATPSERLEVDFRIDVDSESDPESRTRYLALQAFGTKWEDRLNLLLEEGYIDDLLVDEDYLTDKTN